MKERRDRESITSRKKERKIFFFLKHMTDLLSLLCLYTYKFVVMGNLHDQKIYFFFTWYSADDNFCP